MGNIGKIQNHLIFEPLDLTPAPAEPEFSVTDEVRAEVASQVRVQERETATVSV